MSEYEKMDGDIAKLTITVDAEAFQKALLDAYHKNGAKYPVPGFRKGKAPRKIIEANYGAMIFYDAAFDLCWAAPYEEALTEHDLSPVDRPEVDITSISEEAGVVFTAQVQLKPTVTLGAYKGIAVKKQAYTVTDDEVNGALEQEQQKQVRYVDVERPVIDGDRIILDYAGSVDGVAFEGGTAEDQTLDIGSKTFIPGFEDQLVGAAAGEERDVHVTFPEDYHAEDLKGKAAVFACKIKAVQQKETPQVDDEFIKDISEYDTVEEWKEKKKEELSKAKESQAKIARENEVVFAAADNAQCAVPACMIDRQVQVMLQDMSYRLAGSGIKLEDYFRYMGTDQEKVQEMYRPEAEKRVKVELVMEQIRKEENVTASEEDVNEAIELYAAENGMTAEDLKKNLTDADRNYFEDRACVDKVVKILVDSSVETDEAPAEDTKEA